MLNGMCLNLKSASPSILTLYAQDTSRFRHLNRVAQTI